MYACAVGDIGSLSWLAPFIGLSVVLALVPSVGK